MDLDISELLKNNVVILWSGGIDSTGLIFILLKQYSCNIYPIFLRHGQRNLKYEESSVEHYTKNFEKFPKFNDLFIASSDIPALKFKEIGFSNRHLLRNSDLINNAVRYALYKEIDTVLISTYSTDIQDGRLEYLLSKNEEVRTGIEHPEFNIISPFQDKNFPYQTKKSVINFCKENDLDLNQTRSCYEGTEKPCYVCPACKQRDEALS